MSQNIKIVKSCQNCQKKFVKIVNNFQKLSRLSKIVNNYKKMSKIVKVFFGHVMSPHFSDQMFQGSQVSRVALCMSKVKVPSVSE